MDNVFVIALIFAYFRVPPQYQHRVLFWGILGALIMRGLMIAAGAALIQRFLVTLYFFGAFLLFTGVKRLFVSDEEVHPEKHPVLRLAKRFFRVTPELHGQKFAIRSSPREIKMPATPGAAAGSISRGKGKLLLTPLALVLLMVETTDLIFAVDSIPAIFAVTTKPFIVFTSNVFAILGLRSRYFVLAGAIAYFRYLKIGLSFVLVFIGVKMLLDPHGQLEKWFQAEIKSSVSLLVVGAILATSIAVSVTAAKREARAAQRKSRADESKSR